MDNDLFDKKNFMEEIPEVNVYTEQKNPTINTKELEEVFKIGLFFFTIN